MRILVVEDEPDLGSAVARGLRRSGHAVDVVDTIAGAEVSLASSGIDVVVLDWNLPDGAGVDLSRRLVAGEVGSREQGREDRGPAAEVVEGGHEPRG